MKTRLLFAGALVSLAAPLAASPVMAQTRPMVTCKLSLTVARPTHAHTTLWVVYGPPAPTFGIVRMHHASGSRYTASVQLPAGSKARFTYLAGHGITRIGKQVQPGNPVTTIRQMAPVVVSPHSVQNVRWTNSSR